MLVSYLDFRHYEFIFDDLTSYFTILNLNVWKTFLNDFLLLQVNRELRGGRGGWRVRGPALRPRHPAAARAPLPHQTW